MTHHKHAIQAESMDYKAAGCAFTNNHLVLAGYQPTKSPPCISGFGGKKEAGDTSAQHTAWRETLEELLHITDVRGELIHCLITKLVPKQILHQDTYVAHMFDMTDLETMLQIVREFNIESPAYAEFPTTVTELIFNRQAVADMEISHLAILPIVKGLQLDPFFVEDLDILCK